MRASLDAPFAGLGLLFAAMTVPQFAASATSGLLRERLGTIALILAHLVPTSSAVLLEALPEDIQAAIFGNAGTMISFVVGADDAKIVAKEFAPVLTW